MLLHTSTTEGEEKLESQTTRGEGSKMATLVWCCKDEKSDKANGMLANIKSQIQTQTMTFARHALAR